MRYRIEFASKKCCAFADGRDELIKMLKETQEPITDVRRVLASGVSETVMDQYGKYLVRPCKTL